MIKINLLQMKRGRKAMPFPPYLIGTAAFLAASVIGGLAGYTYLKTEIGTLEKKKKDMQAKSEQLTKVIAEVADYDMRNKVFQDRKAIIEDLRKEQSLPVRLMNELSARLTDKIWYTSFSIRDYKIQLSGVGLDNSDIVAFVESLKRSELFKEVYLLETAQTSMSGVVAFTFRVSMEAAGKKETGDPKKAPAKR